MKKAKKIILIVISVVLVIALSACLFNIVASRSLYKNALRILDENYDYMYSVFGDKIATKEEYIDAFSRTINESHVFVTPSKETDSIAGRQIDSRYGKVILVRPKGFNPGTVFLNLDSYSIVLIHETKHAENQQTLSNNYYGSGRYSVFVEGAAKFWEVLSTSKYFFDEGCVLPQTESGLECRHGFDADNIAWYGTGSNAYLKLLMLTDYDTLQRFTENPDNTDILYNKAKENYGIDSKQLIRDIVGYGSFTYADPILDAENKLLNEYFIQDVNRISNREDAVYLLNLYRFFKAEGITYVYDEEMNDHTSEYIDFEPVENALFENVRKYGLLNSLTTDEEEQRYIFNCLLYVPRGLDDFDINDLPKSITDLTLVFDSSKNALYIKDTETDELLARFSQGDESLTVTGAAVTQKDFPETASGKDLVIK